MASLWPWLAVAGVGALHGLNPATGWIFAAARGVRSGDRALALRALLPIAVGHAASVALVAGAVVVGVALDRVLLQLAAVGLLVIVAIVHLAGRHSRPGREPAGQAGLALWSFLMSTTHGAGLMLVPALASLCMGAASGRQISASSSLALALATVGVHTASMLVVSGVIAAGVCRAFAPGAGVLRALRRLADDLRRNAPRSEGWHVFPASRRSASVAPGASAARSWPFMRSGADRPDHADELCPDGRARAER